MSEKPFTNSKERDLYREAYCDGFRVHADADRAHAQASKTVRLWREIGAIDPEADDSRAANHILRACDRIVESAKRIEAQTQPNVCVARSRNDSEKTQESEDERFADGFRAIIDYCEDDNVPSRYNFAAILREYLNRTLDLSAFRVALGLDRRG